MAILSRSSSYQLLIFFLLSACTPVDFTAEVTPLAAGRIESPDTIQSPEGTDVDVSTNSLDDISSEAAIELCRRSEYVGDEIMGSCLAPGGESYYVWISGDCVMEVSRNNPYLPAFKGSVMQRKSEISARDDAIRGLWTAGLLPIEIVGLTSCGVALSPGPQQLVAIPICIGDLAAIGFTAEEIAHGGEAMADAIIASAERSIDAEYNYCLMEGKPHAECEQIRNP